jgi:methylthioribose-1-phosphate isomerase
MTDNHVHSLRFSAKELKLEVLDQLLLPHSKVYVDIPDVEAAWKVIRSMQIRGMN